MERSTLPLDKSYERDRVAITSRATSGGAPAWGEGRLPACEHFSLDPPSANLSVLSYFENSRKSLIIRLACKDDFNDRQLKI